MENNRARITFMQENILALSNSSDNATATNICAMLKIENVFDENICNIVLNKLIETQDNLRIKIIKEDGKYYLESTPFENRRFETLSLTENDADIYIKRIATKNIELLDNNRLTDFKIIKIENANYGYIVMLAHHIICDAWSVRQSCRKCFFNV